MSKAEQKGNRNVSGVYQKDNKRVSGAYHKNDHRHALLGIFAIGMLVTTVVVFLYVQGGQDLNIFENPEFSWRFWEYPKNHPVFLLYLLVINLITLALYGIDKYKAVSGKYRIKVWTLLLFAFAGGSVGAILAMCLFRHKIRKIYFAAGLPLILVTQGIVLLYLANR